MKLVSWNVNGIRAVVGKNFYEAFGDLDADVFAVQETKCQAGQCTLELPGYNQFWSYAQRKGYSGTAVFCRETPLRVLHGLGQDALDTEGRIVACEFDKFWFVGVYVPNAQNELARIDHRMMWEDAFRAFLKNLEAGIIPDYDNKTLSEGEEPAIKPESGWIEYPAGQDVSTPSPKPVVVCGDLNVAHEDIDLKNPGPNRGNAGFSDEERGKFEELLAAGFTDTFRHFYPDLEGAYSWWSYQRRARANNAGWRIDYFLVSDALVPQITSAEIYSEIMGSDHCPVGLTLDI
jgi:exodeoxyribonuclease-3